MSRARLTEQQVEEVLRAAYEESVSSAELVERYGAAHQTIRDIITGKTWKKVYARIVPEGAEVPRERAGTRGAQHGMSKLTVEQVEEIKKRVAAGEHKRDVAHSLDISQRTVHRIVIGEAWKDSK